MRKWYELSDQEQIYFWRDYNMDINEDEGETPISFSIFEELVRDSLVK